MSKKDDTLWTEMDERMHAPVPHVPEWLLTPEAKLIGIGVVVFLVSVGMWAVAPSPVVETSGAVDEVEYDNEVMLSGDGMDTANGVFTVHVDEQVHTMLMLDESGRVVTQVQVPPESGMVGLSHFQKEMVGKDVTFVALDAEGNKVGGATVTMQGNLRTYVEQVELPTDPDMWRL